MRMHALWLLLAFLPACHGLFGARTTDEDRELNNFAEARQRAATYYDGADYVRAALQYERALQYRPKHLPTRLGYAYSLMYTDVPSNLVKAKDQFEKEIGPQRDPKEEVKRIYGLALTYRNLAVHFDRRARIREDRGRIDLARKDRLIAVEYARDGIATFETVLDIDDELAAAKVAAPRRVSASLKPDAHAGIAHCEIVLAEPGNVKPLKRAEHHIREFAKTAANARKFWELRRERILVTDPLDDDGTPGAATLDPEVKARYERRIVGTLRQEAAIRTALMHTYLYLNRYREAITEATIILNIDPTLDEIYLWRGNAYAYIDPPNYAAAVKDLKAYRRSKDLSKLTDELVQINKRIKKYEELEKKARS